MKRLMLVWVMILCLVPLGAWAESTAPTQPPAPPEQAPTVTPEPDNLMTCGDYQYVILEDGTAAILKYNGSDKELTVPSTLDGVPVTVIGERVFAGKWFRSVSLPDGLLEIGDMAFYMSSFYEDFEIPSSVRRIGNMAFYSSSIRRIRIPDGLTQLGFGVFASCRMLAEVSLPQGMASISAGTFEGCVSLSEIKLPDSLTEIGDYAFQYTGLKQVRLPDSVRSLGAGAFEECTGLTSVFVPDSVASVSGNPFALCSSLTDIQITDSHPYLEIRDGVIFSKPDHRLICYPTVLTTPEFSVPEDVLEIASNAFRGNESLVKLWIPDSVTRVGEAAFFLCYALEEVRLPDALDTIPEGAFAGKRSPRPLRKCPIPKRQ